MQRLPHNVSRRGPSLMGAALLTEIRNLLKHQFSPAEISFEKKRKCTNDRISELLVLDEKIVPLSNQPKIKKIQSCQVIQSKNSKNLKLSN